MPATTIQTSLVIQYSPDSINWEDKFIWADNKTNEKIFKEMFSGKDSLNFRIRRRVTTISCIDSPI